MTQKDQYAIARDRAKAKYNLLIHLSVYAAVILLLIVINLMTSQDAFWFVWPMLGWGIAVVLHAARVFFIADRDVIIDKLTERELRDAPMEKNPKGEK